MERLTQWFGSSRLGREVGVAVYLQERYTEEELLDLFAKRLAEYEDTGMTPEQIVNAQNTLRCFDNIGIKRGNEIVTAEEDGRLVVLPCKVGDRVYISGHRFPAQIEEIVINATDGITFNWAEYDRGPEETELWDDGWFEPEEIGKTVFLTREEAEKALEGGPADAVT